MLGYRNDDMLNENDKKFICCTLIRMIKGVKIRMLRKILRIIKKNMQNLLFIII
jgi:hypothetical protein